MTCKEAGYSQASLFGPIQKTLAFTFRRAQQVPSWIHDLEILVGDPQGDRF